MSFVFQEKLQLISSKPTTYPNFQLNNGMIMHKGSIWLNVDNSFIPVLVMEFHATPMDGHLGVTKTIHRLQANFTWDHLQHDVKSFIKNYQTCHQIKHVTRKPVGLLQ